MHPHEHPGALMYVKDLQIVPSLVTQFDQPQKWAKVAKGRVLARKSDKGTVYLQFVTSSGQVVATANIGNLKPVSHRCMQSRSV